MTPLNSHLTVEEVQEDRIQRVEQTVAQVSTQLAEQGIKVGFMSQQISDTKRDLTDKMDSLATDLTKKLDATCARIDKVTDKVERQDDRIDDLEDSDKARKKRWGLFKKAMIFVVTAASGVVISKLIEIWFTKHGG